MAHPFQYCASRRCCCCVINRDLTLYLVSTFCIALSAFACLTYVNTRDWATSVLSLLIFAVHLFAGVLLFLGTLWRRPSFQVAYCWILLGALLLVLTNFVICTVFYLKQDHPQFSVILRTLLLFIFSIYLVAWDIYTPMVVLGNREKSEAFFACC